MIALSMTVSAQADENWDAAKEALAICAKTFPNGTKSKDALKAAGWKYRGVESGMHIYTRNGFRAVAATNAGKSSGPRCFASASKMPVSLATEIAKTTLKDMKNAKELDKKASGGVARWEGQINGVDTILGVLDTVEFGVMRGAGVGFLSR
ncbi:hypothetical protein [Pseudogemmobacter sp. W21_MBD1_M6]|uniref:hypothetical protein n=1 Tax=Pseudogemmobacter sp. W21_MBD1_M6 TaxID=3240271 RepID=UPI003F997788